MEKIFKRPWLIIGIIAAITVFFAMQLPKAEMDNNILAFLPEDIPAQKIQRHFEEEYGDSISIMVGLERPYGTIFNSAFLWRIREFTQAVETIELVKKVNSIMSTQYITSDSESIIVTDLVGDDFSGTQEEITELKRRIGSWDMYRGALVSDDLSSTQIVIQLNATTEHSGDPDVAAVLIKIRGMAKEAFSEFAEVYTAGQSVVSATLTETAYADFAFLIPLVIVVLLGVLAFSFRQVSYVMFPLLTVLVSTIWGLGAMSFLGVKLTLLSMVMPVILIAVGSAYGIHLVSHYKDETAKKTLTTEEHREFVLRLVRKLSKPIFLAALTTFAGFMSFCFAPLRPMRDFGIFSSAGVIIAFLTAITLIPAILLIRGPRIIEPPAQKAARHGMVFSFENTLALSLTSLAKKKALVITVTAIIIIVSITGSVKVIVDNAMVEFFNPSTEVSRSDRFIREHFGGSTQFIISVEADTSEILLHPETLTALDGLCTYLIERVPNVGKVTGFTDMIKRMNQMFNVDESPDGIKSRSPNGQWVDNIHSEDFGFFGFGNFGVFDDFGGEDIQELTQIGTDNNAAIPPASSETPVTFAMLNAAIGKNANMSANELVQELKRMANYDGYSYYEIPSDPARYGKDTPEELTRLIANYLVLLAGDTDNSFSNDPLEPTAIQTLVLVNSQWQRDSNHVVSSINNYVAANFPKNVNVLVGGGAMQEEAISSLVTSSQVVSILVAVIAVLLIIAIFNKSLATGFMAALPLSIAILCNFAVMGFLHITLNMATAMIASLAVGIGIDYTIHFIETFKREYQAGGDYLYNTFATSGKAILINAVSVGAGFAVLAFSRFRIMAQFGSLIALSMMVSAIVSLTVIPVLITTIKPQFIYGKTREQAGVLR